MLMLEYKEGQSIQIGEDITVTVLRDSDGQIRLGIEVPSHMPVYREEVSRCRPGKVRATDSFY